MAPEPRNEAAAPDVSGVMSTPEAKASLALGLLGFAGLYMPVPGFALAACGVGLSVFALRQYRDSTPATVGLTLSCLALALSLAGFVWSLMVGLDGMVTVPAPP